MPLFGRRKPPPPSSESPFNFDANGPEDVAKVAEILYGHQRFSEALVRSEQAIDSLHTLYLFERMRQRQPSPADTWIVDGYTSALGATLAMDQSTDVTESVRTTMRAYAGHVNVDDILWD